MASDLLAEDPVVELNSADTVVLVHHAQVLWYLTLGGKSFGLLIDFNVVHLNNGPERFVKGANLDRLNREAPKIRLSFAFPRFVCD